MIESPQNEKLKLVRMLRERKHRDREGLFVTEGEDLLAAGLAAGDEPQLLLTAAGAGLGGEEVEPELLASVSTLGSGTRAIAVWPQRWAEAPRRPASTCTGSATRATSARSCAPPTPCSAARSRSAPTAPTPSRRRRCGRAWARSSPARRSGRRSTRRRSRGRRSSPTAARGSEALAGIATVCLGAERDGLPAEVRELCRVEVTIPLRPGGAESLNVAAAAAIACERISSRAMREATPDA